MRIFLLGPTPSNDKDVRVFDDAACKLAQVGYVPVMPYWYIATGASADEDFRRSISAMLLCDGIAVLKRTARDRTVTETSSIAKTCGISEHTLAFWLNHHPHDFPVGSTK